jgi:hypothetical protein
MIFRDARSMLVHAYNGCIDHLHGGIVSRRQAFMIRSQMPACRQRTKRL